MSAGVGDTGATTMMGSEGDAGHLRMCVLPAAPPADTAGAVPAAGELGDRG